ncbi:MAG: sugar ABC transporter permease [Spirochaetia bacterium]|nr:sugar ABC transporter permease [Spirochaetia bacterium]
MQLRMSVRIKPYIYLLPAFFFLTVFTYYPIVKAVQTSFYHLNLNYPMGKFVWFANYKEMITSAKLGQVLENTLVYSFLTITIGFILSLFLALKLDSVNKLQNTYKVALFYPTMIPMAAAALIWMWIFIPMYGVLDSFLRKFGIPSHNWLNDPNLALGCLIAVGVWKRLGYYVLFFLAGLQNIPRSLNEAATIDGAGAVRRFFAVTLPMLSSYTFFVFITSIIDSFQAVDQVYIMTQGGPFESTNMIVYYLYEEGFKYYNRGFGSAITAALTLSLLLVTVIIFKTVGKKVYYENE